MSTWMELLRAPALGVVVLILTLAGLIFFGAFAALAAQVGLLLRLKPWNRLPADRSRPAVSTAPLVPAYNPEDVVEGVWREVR